MRPVPWSPSASGPELPNNRGGSGSVLRAQSHEQQLFRGSIRAGRVVGLTRTLSRARNVWAYSRRVSGW